MRKHKPKNDAVFFAVILILESTVLYHGSNTDAAVDSKTVVVDGVAYFPRQDITVVLVMGIDRYGPVEASGSYTNTGAADMDMLVIFDETKQEINMLYLNRDTMLTMPVLGIGGKEAGTYFGQLALAHTYGSGLEDSCENTRKTISQFLGGVRIDYYVSMNMDAIGILNDAVGGVTVEVTEDFSKVDPTIGMGTVKLNGQQAVNFVRTRKDVGDQLNLTRIERQKTYIAGFLDSLREQYDNDANFVLSAYEDVEPYLVSDCSVKVLNTLLSKYASYDVGEVVSPAGENVMGEQYFEFYVDEENLMELVLRLFYAPKE